jgi:hypothetical protein
MPTEGKLANKRSVGFVFLSTYLTEMLIDDRKVHCTHRSSRVHKSDHIRCHFVCDGKLGFFCGSTNMRGQDGVGTVLHNRTEITRNVGRRFTIERRSGQCGQSKVEGDRDRGESWRKEFGLPRINVKGSTCKVA